MWYYRRLAGSHDGLVIMQTRPEHAPQLEELQRVCFPTLADAERFKAAHYRKHIELFADGQFVALDGDRVVGATTTLRRHVGFQPRALLANYLDDPVCDRYSVLIALDRTTNVPGASRKHAMSYIRLNTDIPGPRARDLIARRLAATPAGLGRATDVVVERADGSLIFDVDGNTLIDLAGGIGMLAVGHAPAAVVKAIAEQAQKFVHVCALVATYH